MVCVPDDWIYRQCATNVPEGHIALVIFMPKAFQKESTTKIICILIQCISNFASKDKTKVSL